MRADNLTVLTPDSVVTYVEFVAEEACQVEARLSYAKLMGSKGRSSRPKPRSALGSGNLNVNVAAAADVTDSITIHSGGWKVKMSSPALSSSMPTSS